MATTRRLKAMAEPERTLPNLRQAVDAALDAMPWLSRSDMAMADLARSLAEQIEQAQARVDLLDDLLTDARDLSTMKRLEKLEAMCDVTKTIGWLGPQLQGVLRDLGGAPAARRAMQGDQPVGGRIAKLRADAAKASSGPRKRAAKAVDKA